MLQETTDMFGINKIQGKKSGNQWHSLSLSLLKQTSFSYKIVYVLTGAMIYEFITTDKYIYLYLSYCVNGLLLFCYYQVCHTSFAACFEIN